jgi:MFS family permease
MQRHPRRAFILMVAIGTLILLFAAYQDRYRLNPDGVSYISIAEQYADGHAVTAVNDFYPPMISWLMIPLLKLNFAGQTAFMGTNFMIASATLLLGMLLVQGITKRNILKVAFFWTLSLPILVGAVGSVITPDLLVVLWMLVYVWLALKVDVWLKEITWRSALKASVSLGFIGAFGFMTKQFLLPFFIASIGLWFIVRTLSNLPIKNIKQFFTSYRQLYFIPALVFFFMALFMTPWVVAMSAKDHKLTINPAFSYYLGQKSQDNQAATTSERLLSAQIKQRSINENPEVALIPPPSQYAVAYNECPLCQVNPNSTTTKKHGFDASYYLTQRVKALPDYLRKISSTWYATVPAILILAYAWWKKKISYKKDPAFIISGIFFFVYFGGFLALVSASGSGGNARYYWPMFILSALVVSLSLPKFIRLINKEKRVWQHRGLVLLLIALPIAVVAQNMPTFTSLYRRPSLPAMRRVSNDVSTVGLIPKGSKIASNNKRQALFLAYYLDSSSYASITPDGYDKPYFKDPKVQKLLKQYDIDYYIDYSADGVNKLDLGNTGGKVIRTFNFHRLACANYRYAKSEPCTVSIVLLQKNN